MAEVEGKVALVTGSRRGVGRMLTEHLLRRGFKVYGLARGDATFEHAGYVHMQADIRDERAVEGALGKIRSGEGRLDVLINNAAVAASGHSLVLAPSAVREMLETNLFGNFIVSREAAKLMRSRKWGRIVNIGSMMAEIEPPGGSVYAMTKAALSTLANVMARELGAMGITCNTLAITAIETDMFTQVPKHVLEAIIKALPLPRTAEPDDIFNVIDFLISDRSSNITAQTIWLGGVH